MNPKSPSKASPKTSPKKATTPKRPTMDESDMLLKVNEERLALFLKGLEHYEFKVYHHPVAYKQHMAPKAFFTHIYGILQMYVDEPDDSMELGRMLVLYGVRAFEQKVQTNIFIVSFIYGLEQYYFESPEAEFTIEVINSFCDDTEILKRKLRKWLNIKESIMMHYTEDPTNLTSTLDPVIVNCNEWTNLFKGLNYLFNNYETQMIKRLIDKLTQLGVEETNNVLGSVFAKAVFLLHEDLLREEASRVQTAQESPKATGSLAEYEKNLQRSQQARLKGAKEIKVALEKEKKSAKETRATLARKAHREGEGEVEHIEVTTMDKGKKVKKEDLLQQLETLDDKIYKEGREKRNLQELLDLANSKLRDNSRSYDELFDLTVKLCKDYKKLLDYGQQYFPDTVEDLPKKDFSLLKKFEKNANLYQKSQKLDLIK